MPIALPLYLGFRSTRITESPRKNILLMNRSLFTGLLPLLPLPVLGICSSKQRPGGWPEWSAFYL